MKALKTLLVLAAFSFASLQLAHATATMRLSADGGLTWTNVEDNGPLDSDSEAGSVTYIGPVGNWVVVVSQGLG